MPRIDPKSLNHIKRLYEQFLLKTEKPHFIDESAFFALTARMRQIGWINNAEKELLEENKKLFINQRPGLFR